MINIPVVLTLVRLIGSPLLLFPLLYKAFLSTSWLPRVTSTVVFFLLGSTDFLDGFLARLFAQETKIGKFLDPLADKILILSAMLPLVALGRVNVLVAFIVIAREIVVTQVREVAVLYGTTIPVAWFGKLKMVLQGVYCIFVMLNPGTHNWVDVTEFVVLVAMLIVTIGSGINYGMMLFQILFSQQEKS